MSKHPFRSSFFSSSSDEEQHEETQVADFRDLEQDNLEKNNSDTLPVDKSNSEGEVSHNCFFTIHSHWNSSFDEQKMKRQDGPEIIYDCGPADGSIHDIETAKQKQHAADNILKQQKKVLLGGAMKAEHSDGPEVIFDDCGPFSLESDELEDVDFSIDKLSVLNDAEVDRDDTNRGAALQGPENIGTPTTTSNHHSVVINRDPPSPHPVQHITRDAANQSISSHDAETGTQITSSQHVVDAIANPVADAQIAEATLIDPSKPTLLTDTMKKHWFGLMAVLLLIVTAVATAVVVTMQGSTSISDESITNAVVALSGSNLTTDQDLALTWLLEGGAQDLSADDPRLIQRYVLALMYYSLQGDNWHVRHNFLSKDVDECLWSEKFECNSSMITKIVLSNNNLAGSLPSEIGALESLRILDLGGNNLAGSIPQNLTMLYTLQYLDLQNNELTGSMPESIADMSMLQVLYVNNNQLTGTIPTSVGGLVSLVEFVVNNNMLEGSIPSEIGRLTKLESFLIHANRLTGDLPTELGQFTNLHFFDISASLLSGPIPSEIGLLTVLEELFLGGNKLTGTFPTKLGQLTNLRLLNAEMILLSGPIPSEIGRLTKLGSLSFYDNKLAGPVPTEIGHLTNLAYLYTSTNSLSGSIPSETGLLTKLEELSFYNNKMIGTLPTDIGRLTSLQILQLSVNLFSGPIPSEIGELTKLVELLLNDNKLTGTIPTDVGLLTQMTTLYIQNNELLGSVPSSICNLGQINVLADCPSKVNCSCCANCI